MASRSSWSIPFVTERVIPNYQSENILTNSWGNSASAEASAKYASGVFGSTGFSTREEVSTFGSLFNASGNTYLQEVGLETGEGIDYSSVVTDNGIDLNKNFFSEPSGEGMSWTFVTTPGSISWSTQASVERLSVYGTNTAPVVVGSKGMRDLQLNDALVEGFSRLKSVEGNITALENLMNFTLNGGKGFVNVPVYQVWANSKKYGFGNGVDGGYFVIESVNVAESMRDLDGNTTRAAVDVSFKQVPPYQVDSGRDQASQSQAGAKAALPDAPSSANQGVGGGSRAVSGASGPSRSGTGSTSTQTTAPQTRQVEGTLGRVRYGAAPADG